MKKWLRFIFGERWFPLPNAGEVWDQRIPDEYRDPFRKSGFASIYIVEVREGWARFFYIQNNWYEGSKPTFFTSSLEDIAEDRVPLPNHPFPEWFKTSDIKIPTT